MATVEWSHAALEPRRHFRRRATLPKGPSRSLVHHGGVQATAPRGEGPRESGASRQRGVQEDALRTGEHSSGRLEGTSPSYAPPSLKVSFGVSNTTRIFDWNLGQISDGATRWWVTQRPEVRPGESTRSGALFGTSCRGFARFAHRMQMHCLLPATQPTTFFLCTAADAGSAPADAFILFVLAPRSGTDSSDRRRT